MKRVFGLRTLQQMMREAPPMAAYYQKLAAVHSHKQMKRMRAIENNQD